jgi:predicted RNase H-like HicB family nuclease
MMKKMQLTILVEKGDDGWIVGQLQEFPQVATQGKTISELKDNLKDALKLFLDYQKDQIHSDMPGNEIIKKTLVFKY